MSSQQDLFVGVYSDARSEYTKQLCQFLTPVYFKWFIQLLEKARETTVNEPRKLLWQFQTYLNDIPEWNMEKLNNEIQGIQTGIGCDYLEDLLTAVFIAHTKVLTAIRLTSRQKRIQITVPKIEHFLFKVLCESSKLLWGSSYLFNENVTNIDKQKNYRQAEQLINDGIHQAIRALVPVKSILKDFVNQEEGEGEGDGEGETVETEKKEEKGHDTELSGELANEMAAELSGKNTTSYKKINNNLTETLTELENLRPESEPELLPPLSENISLPTSQTDLLNLKQSQPESQPGLQSQTPIINISEQPKEVSFTNFVTVFSPSNPDNSEIIRESEDHDSDSGSLSLDFLDDTPTQLDTTEFEDLEQKSQNNQNLPMESNDYEVLA